jgi:UDP-GlcNAc:undecaprenyl-phosphate/decaprenyl-phosphate GlcNAc-1-phosphate transferase
MARDCLHLLLLVSAVLGFLVFNSRHRWRRQASVHMGDAGSMMLGAAISFFAVDLSVGREHVVPLPVLLWFFALPMFDMLIVIVRRLAKGSNPLRGDRRHLHHFLLNAGVAPQTATAMLVLACAALGAVGLIGWRLGVNDHLMLIGLGAPFALHAYAALHGWKVVRRRGAITSALGATANTPGVQVEPT